MVVTYMIPDALLSRLKTMRLMGRAHPPLRAGAVRRCGRRCCLSGRRADAPYHRHARARPSSLRAGAVRRGLHPALRERAVRLRRMKEWQMMLAFARW